MKIVDSPLVLSIENTTDKTITTSLFEIRHSHKDLIWKNLNGGINVGNLKLFYSQNRDKIRSIRYSWVNPDSDIFFTQLRQTDVHPNGTITERPICIVGNTISPQQYQLQITEFYSKIQLDGTRTDIVFDITPKQTVIFELFFDDIDLQYIKNNRLVSFIVENNSDSEQIVDIFDTDNYAKYVSENNVKFYNAYIPDSWGAKFADSDKYTYPTQHFNSEACYNFLKITNPSKNTQGIISTPGINIRPEEYIREPNASNGIAIDIQLSETQKMSQFLITSMPPKTKIMYSFGMQL